MLLALWPVRWLFLLKCGRCGNMTTTRNPPSTPLYSTLLPQTAQQKISSFVMMSQRKTFISPCRGHWRQSWQKAEHTEEGVQPEPRWLTGSVWAEKGRLKRAVQCVCVYTHEGVMKFLVHCFLSVCVCPPEIDAQEPISPLWSSASDFS